MSAPRLWVSLCIFLMVSFLWFFWFLAPYVNCCFFLELWTDSQPWEMRISSICISPSSIYFYQLIFSLYTTFWLHLLFGAKLGYALWLLVLPAHLFVLLGVDNCLISACLVFCVPDCTPNPLPLFLSLKLLNHPDVNSYFIFLKQSLPDPCPSALSFPSLSRHGGLPEIPLHHLLDSLSPCPGLEILFPTPLPLRVSVTASLWAHHASAFWESVWEVHFLRPCVSQLVFTLRLDES